MKSWKEEAPLVLAMFFVGWILRTAVRASLGSTNLALGSDPALWGLTAENLRTGVESTLPPLYPWLVAWNKVRQGIDLVPAALGVSGFAQGLILPTGYAVARWVGVDRGLAALMALGLMTVPELVFFGLQLQPDALAVLMLLVSVPVSAWFLASPTLARAAWLSTYGAFCFLIREHGLVLSFFFGLLCLGAAGSLKTRFLRGAMVFVAVSLAPMAGRSAPAPPWAGPWMGRITMATRGSENIPIPQNASQDKVDAAMAHRAAHDNDDKLAIARIHAENAFILAPAPWAWVGLALLLLPAVPKRWRLPLLLPMATTLPTLPILSQPRHVIVAVPVALMTVALALSDPEALWRRGRYGRFLASGVALAGVGLLYWGVVRIWEGSAFYYQRGVEKALKDREFGRRICEMASEGDVYAGDTRDFMVYCPMPHHTVVPWSFQTADWRAWLFETRQPSNTSWQAVGQPYTHPNSGELIYAFRYQPWVQGEQRPCQDSRPVRGTPYLSFPALPAEFDPPC